MTQPGVEPINKRFKLAEKISLKELRTHKKHNNEQPSASVPKETTKSLDQLKNSGRIENILDTTKIIKSN